MARPIYIGVVTDLEREYSPSSRAGGSAAPFVADWRARSSAAMEALSDRVRALPGGTLLADAGAGAPLLVFVHGGYWQALSAAESMYLAPGALSLGWSYAAVEYTIAPEGNLPTMVDEVTAALRSLAAAVTPRAVVLAGHSAGAHLVAMASLVRPSPLRVTRVVLLSGVYDLRPSVMTTVNEPLGLDLASAVQSSPMLQPVVDTPEVTVAWGDDDTDAFEAQSTAYAAVLRRAGAEVTSLRCDGRHHFDIVDDLVDPGTELGAHTLGGLT
jgi:arylformamidase